MTADVRVGGVLIAVVLMLGLASCRVPSPSSPDTASGSSAGLSAAETAGNDDRTTTTASAGVLFTVPGAPGAVLQTLATDLPAVADVVTKHGGSVVMKTDPWGRSALDFPAFSAGSDPPRAIVRLTPDPAVTSDPFSPGQADFGFGADFAVDRDSQGTETDSGNNLLQRGLASDRSQFKLEVDGQRALCRIKGPEGVVELRVKQEVEPQKWYRAWCSRTGDAVQLTVFRLEGNVPRIVEQVRGEGATGDLQWEAGTPLSIGGKLAANGAVIRSQADQFNGLVAEPIFRMER